MDENNLGGIICVLGNKQMLVKALHGSCGAGVFMIVLIDLNIDLIIGQNDAKSKSRNVDEKVCIFYLFLRLFAFPTFIKFNFGFVLVGGILCKLLIVRKLSLSMCNAQSSRATQLKKLIFTSFPNCCRTV